VNGVNDFRCRCGRKIGTLIPHKKYPALNSLDLGNGNIADTWHGHCGVCGAGIHFEWRWELAAKILNEPVRKLDGIGR
jgi:hypothetical protein